MARSVRRLRDVCRAERNEYGANAKVLLHDDFAGRVVIECPTSNACERDEQLQIKIVTSRRALECEAYVASDECLLVHLRDAKVPRAGAVDAGEKPMPELILTG